MQNKPLRHEIVLLGIGHTNAHVLRMWRKKPIDDARLTCVSNFPTATYSGMLPGTLAGQYPPERMEIDLARLCSASGAPLILGEVNGLDRDGKRLLFADRPPLPFDVLSIGIGSVPRLDHVEIDSDRLLPIKPMQTFLTRLDERLARFQKLRAARPLRATVVGGGAGGVEIAFCLPPRVRAILGDTLLQLTLIDGSQRLVSGMLDATAKLIHRELQSRGVKVRLGQRVTHVTDSNVVLESGEEMGTDLVLWTTAATAPPLLKSLGLPVDQRGFLLTRPTLQAKAKLPIFVVGDTGTIEEDPAPKAGVYAVRQGPVVWRNIRRLLENKELEVYKPQRGFLKLLNTGDGRAILEYRRFTFHRQWCWWLKDWIDSQFMAKYQN